MEDYRNSAGSTPLTGKRTFATRINKKGHAAMRREAASISMYLPESSSTPSGGGGGGGAGTTQSPGLMQISVRYTSNCRSNGTLF